MGPKYGILAKHVCTWRRCLPWTKQMNLPALYKFTPNHVQFNRLFLHSFQIQSAARGSIKSLKFFLPSRTFSLSVCKWKRKSADPVDEGNNNDDDNDDDFIEDTEVEELFQQQVPTGIGEEDHRVYIVHPDVKWGGKKQYLTTASLQMAEAVGLVNTLQNWTVVDKIILSTKTPEKKRIFGKGNFQILTEKIRRTPGVTAVFINVERLSPLSEVSAGTKGQNEAIYKRYRLAKALPDQDVGALRELQEAWGVKVFDRYSLVLHIFRRNARTKEAKLQISLAEIPLLRSRLRNEVANLDQQGGGSRYIMGSGETLYEVQQRLLKEREQKICTALERLRKKRHLLHSQRKLRDFPIVAVMGYTNSGKTTLIKALTGDAGLQPKDQLFATLDVTVHAGQLPSYMTVLYVDTIGFLSQLPHKLIDSFSATLEDVAHSDLIIHVRDISHPETVNQKVNVLNILKNLQIPETLMNSIIEVHNKIDLVEGYESSEPGTVPISALQELGLEMLKQRVEDAVVKSTGKRTMILKVQLNSPQLGWLYKEATVQEVHDGDDDCTANVKVLISSAAYGRYRKLFQVTNNG